jgi:serine/threonine protein kinase
MSEPINREEQIFAEALAVPQGERPRLLDEACQGDDALRSRVEMLLRAHDSAGEFMASPLVPDPSDIAEAASSEPGTTERRGTRIGRYKLLQKLGEGGCGVVWMAEQEKPVVRRVALKIIKLGMDTREVIARFDAERQALAMMDHPNIARILDAGATDTGRPFFVMELVRGIRITDYCDQNNLPTAQRLELFSQVCHAVQHAHQKGIIHRDLKPSNILVTLNDGLPVPKVIDFGIAKATEGRLTNSTLFTAFEQLIGTPSYMSPEQAEVSGIDIDTRSDIYSLGVLLYELLTGRLPFDPKALVKAGLDEIRRIIREVEPQKPSTNLSTLADADRVTVARLRGTDPAKLSLLLQGDLDWIVMRCLEKNRTRRYETPTALAADIARHLNNEPVVACPPSRSYRLRKFVRRNRLAFTAAAFASMVLLIGTVVSTWQAVRATRAERAASLERARAEDLLTFMLGDLRGQLAKVGRLDVLEAVADKAMAYFGSLDSPDSSDKALSRRTEALTQLGEIRMDEARYSDAQAAFSEAYSWAAALAARHPTDGDMLFERGQAEYWVGFVHWRRGEFPAATDWLTKYYNTSLALLALDPSKPEWRSELAWGQHNLAVLQMDRREFDASRAGFLAELVILDKLRERDPNDNETYSRIADAHSWLGGLAEQQGNFAAAMTEYSLQTTQLEHLVSLDPGTQRWRIELAKRALLNLVDVEAETGKLDEAGARLSEARGLLDELVKRDPSNRDWLANSLNARLKEAFLAWRRGDIAAASRLLDQVRPKLEDLVAAERSDRKFVLWLAMAWTLEAKLRRSAGRADAAPAAARAVELGEKLIGEQRATDGDVGEFAMASDEAGEIAARSGAQAEAESDWNHAAEILAARLPGTRDWRLLDPEARLASRLGRADEARSAKAQLRAIGYIPPEPWPDESGSQSR